MTVEAASVQSILNALTVLSAEQQTMNFYMTAGNRPEHPLARALYQEIAMIEEQHVTHYESILDPMTPELLNLALHEYNECWLYWSCVETETDPRIKRVWELHLAMELEHLRIACDALREVHKLDAADFFPKGGIDKPMTFEPNKDYVRGVLDRTLEWTGWDSEFVSVGELPADHRYFSYQDVVNAGGTPSEDVITTRRAEKGEEYRFATEGEHPIASLRDSGTGENTIYDRAREDARKEAAE